MILDPDEQRWQTRKYRLPSGLIRATERVLRRYGELKPPNQGLVYWGGEVTFNSLDIKLLFAPRTVSDERRVVVDQRENSRYVSALNKIGSRHMAQVHTHPGKIVDHSQADNELAAFRVPGLLSLVVPSYCQAGILPLTMCGVHRYDKWGFIRLSENYIIKNFEIIESDDFLIEDRSSGSDTGQ